MMIPNSKVITVLDYAETSTPLLSNNFHKVFVYHSTAYRYHHSLFQNHINHSQF